LKRLIVFLSIIAGLSMLFPLNSTCKAEEGKKTTGSDSITIDEIVNRASHTAYYQAKDGRAVVSMVITDSQGRTRKRRFTILRLDQEAEDSMTKGTGEQKFYVYFKHPADVNKMAYLVNKHDDRDDDRWLYLPALDLVKRIAATDERTSFVGSDFFYEDVSGRGIFEDNHELVETTGNYYVLKNTPKNPDEVEFTSFKMWIHKATFIPVKIVYFNKRGNKYREYKALKVDTIDGYPTVVQAEMRDLQTNNSTQVSYGKVEYNIGLPENIFTERYLRNPPRKYIR